MYKTLLQLSLHLLFLGPCIREEECCGSQCQVLLTLSQGSLAISGSESISVKPDVEKPGEPLKSDGTTVPEKLVCSHSSDSGVPCCPQATDGWRTTGFCHAGILWKGKAATSLLPGQRLSDEQSSE